METKVLEQHYSNRKVTPCYELLYEVKKVLIDRRKEIPDSGMVINFGSMPVNSEESLRSLMVIAVPKLRRSQLKYFEISDMLIWISDVSLAVSIDDFRMIDALNVVYEVWPEFWEKDNREKFLKSYSFALDSLIAQL
jgi:hypothetical protein